MLIALLVSLMIDGSAAAADPPAPAAPAPTASAAATPSPAPPSQSLTSPTPLEDIRVLWREHPSVRAGRNFRLDFAVKFQYDGRDPGDVPPALFKTWEIHRMRFGIEGEIFRKIQYQVEREEKSSLAANPLKSPWRDVYADVNIADGFQVRGGKFKIPFGLDAQGGDASLDFVYRSLGGYYLAPGRDIGAMAHGRFFKRALNYWVGGFKKDGENSRSAKDIGFADQLVVGAGDRAGAGRVTVRPFAKSKGPLGGAEIGVDYMFSNVSDEETLPNGLRARSVVTEVNLFERVFVKGQRRRMGVDLDWTTGPFGAQAEFIQVNEQRQAQGLGDQDLPDARGRSYYVVGSYVLTGEDKSDGVVPKKGLLMGGIGAVEVAARYDQLKFDSQPGQDPPFRNSRAETIFPGGDRVWTFGVNWYVNRWIKLQGNVIHEHAIDPERSPTPDGSAFWSKVFRLQLEL